MLPTADWEGFLVSGSKALRPPSLVSEGFIHCTAGERNLIGVATRYYAAETATPWTVLVIDPARLLSELRWEPQPDGLAYPHIYGPLNRDAVVESRAFPRSPTGAFLPFF